jgi:hypothetical protein
LAVLSVFLSNQINRITSENYVYVHSFRENNMGKREMEKSGRSECCYSKMTQKTL